MLLSWGRAHRFDQEVHRLSSQSARAQWKDAHAGGRTVIAHGLGRSYGDVALNDRGAVAVTDRFDQIIAADWETGVVRAQSGLSLGELLKASVPRGWFAPVSPGTKFVTLGGAVANDVHGKNHHVAGSFGAHVRALKLARSDSPPLICSPSENADLFALTIGGLGLTGFIEWVECQLQPIGSAFLEVETIAQRDLAHFFRLSEDSAEWPYTVAWIDCFAPERALGRGVFSRARFLQDGDFAVHGDPGAAWPITTPGWLLNRASVSAFNALYRRAASRRARARSHYEGFFYPLDRISGWNKLYGANGFYQHQSIIPTNCAEAGISALLGAIASAGQGSFLAVLKLHGRETSPGVLSFCRDGASLALDFANRGAKTLNFLTGLDAIVEAHGGRLYPAKDGRMAGDFFRRSYPRWEDLEARRDPVLSSSFWRRVTHEQ